MLSCLIFSLLCITSSFGGLVRENPLLFGNRIVGGEETTIEEFPYQISLEYGTSHRCGGSILDESTILTAAHCTYGLSSIYFYVRAGTANVGSGGQRVQVSEIRENLNYNPSTINNDIAILKLASPLEFSESVAPVALPFSNITLEGGEPAVVSGWGVTSEGGSSAAPILRQVEVEVVDRQSCYNSYLGLNTVTQQMVCAGVPAGGKDACQGDSGGPLVLVDTQEIIGVVSWGLGCARPGYPGVYASVPDLLEWIEDNRD